MRVAVVTAVGPETRAVRRAMPAARRAGAAGLPRWVGRAGIHDVELVQAGVGFACARRATAALTAPPDVLLSCGFAGALRAGVGVGTVILCDAVLWEDGSHVRRYEIPSMWTACTQRALAATSLQTVAGALLSSPIVLATTTAKAAAGLRHGAVGVEMEAAPLVEYAEREGLAVVPLRVVLDAVDLSLADLPHDLASSWQARARLVTTPGVWHTVATARRLAGIAGVALTRAVAALLPALEGRG